MKNVPREEYEEFIKNRPTLQKKTGPNSVDHVNQDNELVARRVDFEEGEPTYNIREGF